MFLSITLSAEVSHCCFESYKGLHQPGSTRDLTIALTGAARHKVGPMPRKNVPNPSLRYDCIAQSSALEYFLPGPIISVCNRDLITSIVSPMLAAATDWIRSQPHGLTGSKIRQVVNCGTMLRINITSILVYLLVEYPSTYLGESMSHTSESTSCVSRNTR